MLGEKIKNLGVCSYLCTGATRPSRNSWSRNIRNEVERVGLSFYTMEVRAAGRTSKQSSTANMKSKLKKLMTADDGGMKKREVHTQKTLGVMTLSLQI